MDIPRCRVLYNPPSSTQNSLNDLLSRDEEMQLRGPRGACVGVEVCWRGLMFLGNYRRVSRG